MYARGKGLTLDPVELGIVQAQQSASPLNANSLAHPPRCHEAIYGTLIVHYTGDETMIIRG
jgi:hypothetical protein